jgi:propionyl-CoA carboxylase alpha chain
MQVEKIPLGYTIRFMGSTVIAKVSTPRAAELNKFMRVKNSDDVQTELVSQISGLVVDIKIAEGEKVTKGQTLAIIEAMKMENAIVSLKEGVVKKIHVQKSDNISAGQVLIEIE